MRKKRKNINHFLLTKVLFGIILLAPSLATIADDRPMSVRSTNPFTRVFGLPMYPSINEFNAEDWELAYVLEVVNHADTGFSGDERLVLDGESNLSNFMLSYALSDSWQFGADLSYVQYDGGVMDTFIENWHDAFDFTNSDRLGPHDLLQLTYTLNESEYYNIVDDNSGFGDVRLWSSFTFMQSENTRMSVRGTVKLPTGDSKYLHGSDAADFAVDVAAMHRLFSGKRPLSFSGYAGVMMLGDGDVISILQKDSVVYGGIGLVWEYNSHWDVLAQIQAQSSYFDSDLVELGESYQISLGVRYLWLSANADLLLGITEDFIDDATPDFGVNFELRKSFK